MSKQHPKPTSLEILDAWRTGYGALANGESNAHELPRLREAWELGYAKAAEKLRNGTDLIHSPSEEMGNANVH